MVNQQAQIRTASVADATAISEIHARSKRSAYRGLVSDVVLASISGEERVPMWHDALSNPTLETFVADISGNLAGFILFGPSNDTDCPPTATMEIHALYVDPEKWRFGIGRELLGAATFRGIQLSFSEVCVWTALPTARLFYESQGFINDGTNRVSPLMKGSDVEVTDVRYRMSLVTQEANKCLQSDAQART